MHTWRGRHEASILARGRAAKGLEACLSVGGGDLVVEPADIQRYLFRDMTPVRYVRTKKPKFGAA